MFLLRRNSAVGGGKPPPTPPSKAERGVAIARLCVRVGKAGKAAPHAAYIARAGQYAERLERGEKLEATEAGNMPAWAAADPMLFWQAADAHERANGTTYREFEIALPRELTPEQRVALVRDFVRQEIGDRHAYTWAIHVPTAADGGENPHVHLMFSERQIDGIERDPEQYFKRYNAKNPERGGCRKGYGPSAGKTLTRAERAVELKALRARWQALCNAHLERAGSQERIDMRSNAERGIAEPPERKQGPKRWRGDGKKKILEFRAAKREAAEVQAELTNVIIDLEAARAKREQARIEAKVMLRPAVLEAIRKRAELEKELSQALDRRQRAQTAAKAWRAAHPRLAWLHDRLGITFAELRRHELAAAKAGKRIAELEKGIEAAKAVEAATIERVRQELLDAERRPAQPKAAKSAGLGYTTPRPDGLPPNPFTGAHREFDLSDKLDLSFDDDDESPRRGMGM